MLSGLFGDPLWCVLFAYLHKNFAYDTLSHIPSRHTHTLSISLSICGGFKSVMLNSRFPSCSFFRKIMKIIRNNTKNHSARALLSVPFGLGLVSSVGSAWRFVRCRRMQHKSFISSQCALALFGTAQMDINSWQQFWRFSGMMMLMIMMYSLLPTGFIFN